MSTTPSGVPASGGALIAELSRRARLEGGNTGKEVGYGSVSHFISEFRARFGVTPRAYSDAHVLSRELRAQRDDQTSVPTSRPAQIQQDQDII